MSTAVVDHPQAHPFSRELQRPASPTIQTLSTAPDPVRTTVIYGAPAADGEEIYYRLEDGKLHSNYVSDSHEVNVSDARKSAQNYHLHRNGFQLERLQVPEDIDWNNLDEVKARYWPLAAEMIKQAAGATRVHVFDTTVRGGKVKTGDDSMQDRGADVRAPVPRVHVDYTLRSGINRLHEVLPEEADTLKKTPFAVIQVWRPLKGPVDEAPLALIDAQSLAPDDLLTARLDLPSRTGYTYAVKHNPEHKFYYFKGMTTEEALVFKCYDSRKNVARFGPHTAFKDPHTPADAAPRESIEMRAYAFFEDQPEQPIALEH